MRLFCLILFCPITAFSQVDTKVTKFLSFKVYMQAQGTRLAFENSGDKAYYDVLRSAESLSALLGYQLSYKDTFSISYYNIDQGNEVSYSSELRSSLNLGRWWFDIFIQHFKDLGLATGGEDFWVTGPHTLTPDSNELKHSGANAYFIKEPKNFSMSAVVDQSARQTRSGGSLLYGISFFNTEISSRDGFFSALGAPNFTYAKLSTTVGSVGFGYSLVAFQSVYLSGVLLGGLGQQQQTYEMSNDRNSGSSAVTKLNSIVGMGYNGSSGFTGLTVRFDILQYEVGDVNITNRQSDVQIFVGMRF